VLEGEEKDIHAVRCMDAVIGRLLKSFNSSAKGSARAVKKMEGHLLDLAPALKRVQAFTTEGDVKTPVTCLEYVSNGKPVLKIKLG
jgi:hypothetical protein